MLHKWIIPIVLFIGFIVAFPLTALSQKTLRLDLKKGIKAEERVSFKTSSREKEKLVQQIDVYDISSNSKVYTINPWYDSDGRIVKVKYTGNWGMFVNTVAFYETTGKTLKLSGYTFDPVTGDALMPKTEAITCLLNDMGYIVEEKATGDYTDSETNYYEYDDSGQTLSNSWVYDNYSGSNTYEWVDGNIHISSHGSSITDYKYVYTSIVNKANINLNKLFTQTFGEDVSYLALFGYLGNKDRCLIEKVDDELLMYTFDDEGCVSEIIKESGPYTGRYVISYDETISPDPDPTPDNNPTTEDELGGAIDNAPEGTEDSPTEIFIPSGGITLHKPLDVDKHIRLKGGSLLRGNDNPYAMLRIRSGYSLELDDIIIDGNRVSQKDGSLIVYGKLKLKDGVTIKNCKRIEADTPSGAVCIAKGGELTMDGGTITGNIGAYGSAVYNEGIFTMTDGEISSNTGQIGAVANNGGGQFIMTGGKISSNKVTDGCGGVFVSEHCFFRMTGGEISGNEDCALYTWANLQIGGQAKVDGLTLMNDGNRLLINPSLRNNWQISYVETPPVGTIVAVGYNGYQLADSDLQKVIYYNNVSQLKLAGNSIVTYQTETGVEGINEDLFRLSASGNQVQVEGLPSDTQFTIYEMGGRIVASYVTGINGQACFSLDKGVYLFNCKERTVKFMVR